MRNPPSVRHKLEKAFGLQVLDLGDKTAEAAAACIGKYDGSKPLIVLGHPEQVLAKEVLDAVVTCPHVRNYLLDEAHHVSEWDHSFRQQFCFLHQLHAKEQGRQAWTILSGSTPPQQHARDWTLEL